LRVAGKGIRLIEINYLASLGHIHSYFKYFKMKSFRILLAAATIIVIGMAGCSKGSAGPAGPTGPVGPDSVFSSQWIILQFVGSIDANSDSLYDETITAPSITKAILDSGIILSYVNAADPQSGLYFVKDVSSLPQFFYNDFSVGSTYITSFGTDLSGTPYRYVTIPGNLIKGNGIKRTVKGYTQEELKAMSYEKVQQILANN
jgi:hypothetical protein